MVIVEVASNSVQSAIAAQKGGASRIELCGNLSEGGTTPAKSQIELTRQYVDIDLNVIIRPRGGDFFYDDLDFISMKKDIELCGQLKCDGVVLGILDAKGSVDMKRNAELISIAKKYGLSVTFHRAFDRVADLSVALEDVIKLGCDRILTSGGLVNAYDGREVIRDLIVQAKDRIVIMPGAGVKEDNVAELVKITKAKEVHGTFQSLIVGKMEYFNANFKDQTEYTFLLSNEKQVSRIVELANF